MSDLFTCNLSLTNYKTAYNSLKDKTENKNHLRNCGERRKWFLILFSFFLYNHIYFSVKHDVFFFPVNHIYFSIYLLFMASLFKFCFLVNWFSFKSAQLFVLANKYNWHVWTNYNKVLLQMIQTNIVCNKGLS